MFFKKKNKKENKHAEAKIDETELRQRAEQLMDKLDPAVSKERIDTLNELGGIYFTLNEVDNAIKYYEISINENRSLGKAYTDLLKLYNLKRKQAVNEKDEAATQLYLDKIDDLMKLSKDVIRGL